jgi:hypothetical protein
MCFAPDHDVTETLAPDQSDPPFGNALLPKRELVRSASLPAVQREDSAAICRT